MSYVLSFVYVGIYWNNHHHLMHFVERINGKVMWANLHMLFWVSLFPFTTAWLNESHGVHGEFPATLPTLVYGVVLLMTALAWIPLVRSLIRVQRRHRRRLGVCAEQHLEGKDIASHLPCGHCLRTFRAHRVVCAVRGRVDHLGRPRPPHRTARDAKPVNVSVSS